jgi:DNA-binding transcriptional MerR regulator
MEKENEFLGTNEVMEFLGVCEKTLRRYNNSGSLKSYRNIKNRYRVYRVADLKDFLDKKKGRRGKKSGGSACI